MFCSPLAAQDYEHDYDNSPNKNYISDAHYIDMSRKLLSNPVEFDFSTFRSRYISSRYYDPTAENLRRQMLEAAFAVQTSEDEKAVSKGLLTYNAIVRDHLANMNVIILALSLARDDPRFGDISFFQRIRDGLYRQVRVSGDGKSLNTAYEIVTMAEEAMLLNRMNVKLLSTKGAKEGIISYNMHDVEGPSGRQYTVFVNLTRPMDFLERQEFIYSTPLDLGFQ